MNIFLPHPRRNDSMPPRDPLVLIKTIITEGAKTLFMH
ncbi:hypothetical protein YPPY60_2288 [Yersinia pestis PY-60]|nr:hypothetical protein YPPY05_2245 [Yersinia pestis PY-05]EIS29673.1 hypothetical protein YPPY55_2265 [Yersinia pestis PY-55]EIS34485.1 hypothetical protein YPPY55_0098 [Yersinia pestis PY-55]EIS44087.1 hypothetical protein YPPY60_2288 [Yersinia pestis PY-60]EIS96038.1 hypothetical protein YPPY89_2480 [Yersinia pestis PY-89]